MPTTKRIDGDYNIISIDTQRGDNVSVSTHTFTVNGNLTVIGTTTTVNSTDTAITDRLLILNNGESGAGVTGVYSGFQIDLGSAADVAIRWNESSDQWELTTDGSTYNAIQSGVAAEVVDDTSPQLGGNLDVNGYSIVSVSNGDIVISPNGSGITQISGGIKLGNGSAPSATASYTKLYAATPGTGGTGLFFVNTAASDELVSTAKAVVYGIIF